MDSSLLKSLAFWTAIVGLFIMVLNTLFPQFTEVFNQLSPIILQFIGILVGGFGAVMVAQRLSK